MSPSESHSGLDHEPLNPKIVARLAIQSRIVEQLVAELGAVDIQAEATWQRAERRAIDMIEDMDSAGEIPRYIDQDTLIKDTLNETLALGPLEDLLADERIESLTIYASDRIVVRGHLHTTQFSSDAACQRCLARYDAEGVVSHVKYRRGNAVVIERAPDGPEPPDRPPDP
jgi:hypothetical protein